MMANLFEENKKDMKIRESRVVEDSYPVSDIISQLNDKADLLYKFVIMYSSYIAEKHDYGTGELLTMAEAHTLSSIEENPGITVTQLADFWNHTKGAISQIISRLEKKGFVNRRQLNGNTKNVHLYVTEKGVEFCRQHRIFDSMEVSNTIQELLCSHCTIEEIDNFFKVITAYIKILRT